MNLKLRSPISLTYPSEKDTNTTTTTTTTTEEKKRSNINIFIDAACPICQEPVGQRTPEGKTESWSRLPCGHKFGSHCIKHWLGMVAEERPCCPICRQNASYGCGHPVLPELMTSKTIKVATAAKRRDDVERQGAKAGVVPETYQAACCMFCRQYLNRTRKKKRLRPWRFVKGCWRLVRTGRVRERQQQRVFTAPGAGAFPGAGMIAYFPGFGNAEWQRWWKEQEPKSA